MANRIIVKQGVIVVGYGMSTLEVATDHHPHNIVIEGIPIGGHCGEWGSVIIGPVCVRHHSFEFDVKVWSNSAEIVWQYTEEY